MLVKGTTGACEPVVWISRTKDNVITSLICIIITVIPLETQLFVEKLVQANNQELIKCPYYWPFVKWNHWSLVDSRHKTLLYWTYFHVRPSKAKCCQWFLITHIRLVYFTLLKKEEYYDFFIVLQCAQRVDSSFGKSLGKVLCTLLKEV